MQWGNSRGQKRNFLTFGKQTGARRKKKWGKNGINNKDKACVGCQQLIRESIIPTSKIDQTCQPKHSQHILYKTLLDTFDLLLQIIKYR